MFLSNRLLSSPYLCSLLLWLILMVPLRVICLFPFSLNAVRCMYLFPPFSFLFLGFESSGALTASVIMYYHMHFYFLTQAQTFLRSISKVYVLWKLDVQPFHKNKTKVHSNIIILTSIEWHGLAWCTWRFGQPQPGSHIWPSSCLVPPIS